MDRDASALTAPATAGLITTIATIDGVLDAHTAQLGRDFAGYRNHVYRVANFCIALAPNGRGDLEKIAIAAAFHDLGIWTAGTFDYLAPSVACAAAWLEARGQHAWIPDVARMIDDHHKISAATADRGSLVEPFRRADWIDVLLGIPTFGLPRPFIRAVRSTWPDAGFHLRLLQLSGRRLLTHPLSPLPMVRL